MTMAGLLEAELLKASVVPPSGKTVRLRRDGVQFVRPDGSVFEWKGYTGFTALQDYLDGNLEKLSTYVGFIRSRGANVIRVFGMWSVTGFDPRRYGKGAYLEGLDDFLAWMSARGVYVHFTFFTDQVDGSSVRMSAEEQGEWLRAVLSVCREANNVFFEVCNEDWKNGRISAGFPEEWFVGVLSTRSAAPEGEEIDRAGSLLDYTVHHTPRDAGPGSNPDHTEWERKAKELADISLLGYMHDGDPRPATRIPAIATEPPRIAEGTTPDEWAAYAMCCRLWGGMNVHGGNSTTASHHQSNLQRCEVPTGEALACCDAVAEVWALPWPSNLPSVGMYTRGPFESCPMNHDDGFALRTFFALVGDKAYGGPVSPKNSWSTAWALKPGFNVVDVARTAYTLERVSFSKWAETHPLQEPDAIGRNAPRSIVFKLKDIERC